MCIPTPKAPKPQVQTQAAPTTSSTPDFESGLAEIDTQSTLKKKNRKGKDKLKIAAADPALSVNTPTGSSGSGVNIT
tara:strand:- start:84 stop:314 length:231 start_codon:yes stop_codon:yes gene_type:complete